MSSVQGRLTAVLRREGVDAVRMHHQWSAARGGELLVACGSCSRFVPVEVLRADDGPDGPRVWCLRCGGERG